jgi:hypothetical protein
MRVIVQQAHVAASGLLSPSFYFSCSRRTIMPLSGMQAAAKTMACGELEAAALEDRSARVSRAPTGASCGNKWAGQAIRA